MASSFLDGWKPGPSSAWNAGNISELPQAGDPTLAQSQQQQGYTADDAALVSRAIGQMRQEMEREYGLKKRSLDNDYRTALMNARTSRDVAEANRKYQEGQLELAKERLQFDREVQQQEFGLKQAQLGYSVLGMAANLKGPANYFAASNLARNTAAQPGTSTFLNALQNNARLSGFGAQAGSPDAETLGTLTAKLTGQGNTGDGSYGGGGGGVTTATNGVTTDRIGSVTTGGANAADNAYLNQIHAMGARGAHKMTAGSLEQLTPTERSLFISGLETADENGKAFDPDTFLDQYRRSRIGQGIGMSRAA